MPSRAFCSDESQGYPIILITKHFGTFPFNHGLVGGIVATDRHAPHSHHGKDLVIIQAWLFRPAMLAMIRSMKDLVYIEDYRQMIPVKPLIVEKFQVLLSGIYMNMNLPVKISFYLR